MTTLAFDTHAAVKTLREAGFEEAQAEAVVATVGVAMGENVATKTDIQALKADLDALEQRMTARIATTTAEIQTLEQRMTAHIAGRFETLYRNLWAMAVGIVAVTVTLVKLIP